MQLSPRRRPRMYGELNDVMGRHNQENISYQVEQTEGSLIKRKLMPSVPFGQNI